MWKNLLRLLPVWMMTGCALGTTPIVAQLSLPQPPAADMQPCPELPPAESGKAGDLLSNHAAVAKLYHECKARQQGLADHAQAVQRAMTTVKQ